jgi:formylglycine-generating enzyme required for sulfatase activity
LLGIAIIALKMRPPVPTEKLRVPLPGPVNITAGKYLTPDGLEISLPEFRVSAHEVTIGQYAEFLETIRVLAKDNRQSTFDLADQPADKKSHEPTDWPALLAAAKSKELWQNQVVTLDSPVSGVDWWDASAYAEWKKARLPTQEEWFAALTLDYKTPAALPSGPLAPVTLPTSDRTPLGLVGMAGSVCEWTSTLAPNPTNPLGEPLWVIIGGSFQKPGSNALTREWTANRSLRRPDLGFRVTSDAQ